MTALAAWLDTREFAARAGVGERVARRALQRCMGGGRWRAVALIVAWADKPGRGGKAGWALRVRADSLPADLGGTAAPKAALAVPSRDELARIEVSASLPADGGVWHWRRRVIGPALAHPPRSAERKAAVRAIAGQMRELPSGRTGRVSRTTVYRWIAAYDRTGLAGLQSARTGNPRPAIVTRRWDKAVPFDGATKRRITDEIAVFVNSHWAAGQEHGWRQVARFASHELAKATVAAGFDPGGRELARVCQLTRTFVERGRPYRALAIKDRDAKRFADEQPRVRRTVAGLAPMAVIEGDVHHLDVLLRRPDGSTFTPKAVAWLDRANRRLFATLVFLPKGKGVRQEHVIESFVAMTAAERWGMPQLLYLDNGGEYNWASFVDDAMRLDMKFRLAQGDAADRRSKIVRAQPYNAPAKSIEPAFGVIERSVLSQLPGWIGGDRMRAPTKNVGRKPEVWPGAEDEFRQAFQTALEVYETTPQHDGELGGQSPREAFAAAVDRGWERTAIDAEALRTIFADEHPRTVERGCVRWDNAGYTARELQGLPARSKVTIRVPRVGPADRLAVLHDGALLCVAKKDTPFGVLDPAGAVESAARKRAHRKGVKAMEANTRPLDMIALQREMAAAAEPAPVPKVGATIRLGEKTERIARELEKPPAREVEAEAAAAPRRRSPFLAALVSFYEKAG